MPPENKLRMDLNLPALERLLGGDTEIEASLRQQVAEQFAKHHLKPLLNDEMYRRIQKWWEEEVRKAVEEEVDKLARDEARYWFNEPTLCLTHGLRDHINKFVRQEVEAAVKSQLKEYQEKFLKRDVAHVETVVTRALDQELEKRVQDEIQRRLTVARDLK